MLAVDQASFLLPRCTWVPAMFWQWIRIILPVRSTRENAEANQVLENLETGQGSVDEILADQFSIKKAPVVVANILAPILIRLLDTGLADLVERGRDTFALSVSWTNRSTK